MENKILVREFIEMIKSNCVTAKDKENGAVLKLKPEERNKLIKEIQDFFEQERNEDIGIIAATEVLEFFLENLGGVIHNNDLNQAKLWMTSKLEDIEIDYDMLYK